MDYKQLIEAFGDAFNHHDATSLVSMMTEDCVFYTLGGDQASGTPIHGKQAVKAAFEAVWQAMPDAQWKPLNSFVDGANGLSLWHFTGTNSDGSIVDAHGCDIFTFKDGKIQVKNAFRKNCPLQNANA